MKRKYLNIACGDIYIDNNFWENIDFSSKSSSIKKVNILNGLPYDDNTFDIAYSSHFIEHIPKEKIPYFLSEVSRVLKVGGIFRIITPDLEFLTKEYIANYEMKDFKRASFISSLIIDQCVRNVSGGELIQDLEKIYNSNDNSMINYVKELTGPEVFNILEKHKLPLIKKIINALKDDPKSIFYLLQLLRIKTVIKILPRVFRDTNVSQATIGEKHFWIYDYESLSKDLKNHSFHNITKVKYNSTTHKDYIFRDLDEKDSLPRKGTHQIFVEAEKK